MRYLSVGLLVCFLTQLTWAATLEEVATQVGVEVAQSVSRILKDPNISEAERAPKLFEEVQALRARIGLPTYKAYKNSEYWSDSEVMRISTKLLVMDGLVAAFLTTALGASIYFISETPILAIAALGIATQTLPALKNVRRDISSMQNYRRQSLGYYRDHLVRKAAQSFFETLGQEGITGNSWVLMDEFFMKDPADQNRELCNAALSEFRVVEQAAKLLRPL